MRFESEVMFVTLTGATNSSVCKPCQAGSYGSGSGELMWIGVVDR
jgi:hypothetical protein